MQFSDDLLDDIRSRLPCSQVVGRLVKLRKAGREWKGLSPFNQEKTPSFFVNDAKERWFDFSAGKSGDIFTFMMETRGLSFPEAVEMLAVEAGVSLPARNPEAETARVKQTAALADDASRYAADMTDPTRAYLAARGITSAMIDRFGLGYASTGRFRRRITIPIHDMRGRLVGFGARTMGDEQPKYLNSADDDGFSKGDLVYNAHRARQPAHDGQPVLVTEGYFDVISLAAAGFDAAVCTMGTALTEAQLRQLWRLADVPIMMFDGDAAGQRAAMKVAKLAFAHVTPGRSLKFAMLPRGVDPDDLVRAGGRDAIERHVAGACGLADSFWRMISAGRHLASPDARGALEADMMEVFGTIQDRQLRGKYIQDARQRVNALGRRRPIVRANGNSRHSTAPGAIRLAYGLDRGGSFSLKEAVLIASMCADMFRDGADIESMDTRGITSRASGVLARLTDLASEPRDVAMQGLDGLDVSAALHEAFDICEAAGLTVQFPSIQEVH